MEHNLLKGKHHQIYVHVSELKSICKAQTEFYTSFYSEVEERIIQSSLILLRDKWIHLVIVSCTPQERVNSGGACIQRQGSEARWRSVIKLKCQYHMA